jgi:glycosyltransferase involved in cell wall biosynthesis
MSAPRRVGIDGYNLAMPRGTGVATYGYSLSRALQGMGQQVDGLFGIDVGAQGDTRELLFFDGLRAKRPGRDNKMWLSVATGLLRSWMATRMLDVPLSANVEKRGFVDRLPSFDRLWSSPYLFELGYAHMLVFGSFLTVTMPDPPEIMHWTYPLPVRLRGAKNIYTLHDLVPLRLPYATLDDKRYYHHLARLCVAQADHICTVSEASRTDILQHFAASPDKVTNCYQASPVPDEVLASSPEEDARIVEGMFGLKRKGYLLFFGALDPKKNLDRIIDAYLTSGAEVPLVVVSAKDWGMGKPGALGPAALAPGASRIEGQSGPRRIIQLDYLPRAILFRLIRTARAVMFPSLYEGFGLPALEAIQLGTPVVASNVSSLPEVVGDAGLLVDPYSISAIAEAMTRISTDHALYDQLIAAGPAQAAKFTLPLFQERLAGMYGATLRG